MSEEQMQAKAFQNLWNDPKRFDLRGRVRTINNNSTGIVRGALNKSMGVMKGTPDMFYIIDHGIVWLEWKTEKGRQTPEQRDFQYMIERSGGFYYLIRSEEEFLTIINKYY